MASAADSCTGGGVLGGGTEDNGGGRSLAPSIGGSLGRERRSKKHMQDGSDDELDSSQHLPVLERVKSDRAPVTKPEEDRRRRTIIVEKKGGSYGFTLQSYGIHYKKEQEIEMITYVDYVEYDGPAYRAGMREGDVILSINGTDMEKADHKTLVAFIKDCDTRMRMVVLFEDCVRKVELHMKYLQLQNVLQSKMNELERVCLRERQLLEGKWKTHSLPARKKATTSPTENATTPSENDVQPTLYHRPALSTEDVMNVGRQRHAIIPPPAQFMLTYQYLDPNVRYVLKPSTSSSSGEYFVSVGTASGQNDRHYILARASSTETNASIAAAYQQHAKKYESPKPPLSDPHRATANEEYLQRTNEPPKSTKSGGRHCHGPSCNPCLGHFRKKVDKNGDNVSLDAYDLASPCCDPHCVPTRRRSRHHKEHHHKHKHRDRETKERQRPRSQSHASPNPNHHHHHQRPTYPHQQQPNEPTKSRYSDLTAGLASHCSLHSCTSSEFAPAESSASYTTSLSTDTLYWDPQSDNTAGNSRQHSTKSKQSFQVLPNASKQQLQQQSAHLQQGVFQQRYHLHATQIQPASHIYHHSQYVHKPKSWDNLTTKAFGGYGFGYGYLDTVGPKPTIKMQVAQQRHSIPRKNPYGRYSTFTDVENYAPPPSQFVEETTTTTITTKSTENLINTFNISETNLRCDCTDQTKMKKPPPNLIASVSTPGGAGHQYQPSAGHSLPGTIQKIECRSGYYSNLPRTNNASTSTRNGGVATISEITRL